MQGIDVTGKEISFVFKEWEQKWLIKNKKEKVADRETSSEFLGVWMGAGAAPN